MVIEPGDDVLVRHTTRGAVATPAGGIAVDVHSVLGVVEKVGSQYVYVRTDSGGTLRVTPDRVTLLGAAAKRERGGGER